MGTCALSRITDAAERGGLCLVAVGRQGLGRSKSTRGQHGKGAWRGGSHFPQISEGKDCFTEDQARPGAETELAKWKALSQSPVTQPFGELVRSLLQRAVPVRLACCLGSLGLSQPVGHRQVTSSLRPPGLLPWPWG